MKKVLTVLFVVLVATGLMLTGCEEITGPVDFGEIQETNPVAATTITGKLEERGTHDGYDYELWADKGTVKMVLENGGNFSAEWSNIGNILCRKGKKFDSTKTHGQIGKIEIEYAAEFEPGGNSYLCVYGWTKDPLVEYYIVESWGTYRPTGTSKGTANINGGTYDLYETTRNQQPSIEGTKTFKQYWSVRQSKRTSGTITVTDHFNAWHGAGMSMAGKLYEVALTAEGYQSNGKAKITKHYLNLVGGGSSGSSSGSSGGSSGGSSSGSSGGSTGSTTTSSGATKVEAENMTKSGQYTGGCTSPFNGVTLYANDDKVSFNQNFSNNSHVFKVRGASTSSSDAAQVQLKIGGTSYGTFSFSGTSATEKSITATHNKGGGSATVELVCVNDNGKWDAKIDWIEISANGSSSSGSSGSSSGNTNNNNNNNSGSTSSATTKYTFSQLKNPSVVNGGVSYSVNSSGALGLTFTGQYKEVKYDLPSNLSLSNYSSIVINGSSGEGNTAVKFYGTDGKEAFVKYNNKTSSTADWTYTLASGDKSKTIKTIGIMSQDSSPSSYKATINSITFK